MLSPNPDMFRTAYQQITSAERAFVDALVREMAESAQRYGRPIGDVVDAPLPPALRDRDTKGWLQRPLVIAAITERVREIQHYEDVSIDTVIRQLHAIATFDITEAMGIDDFGQPHVDLTNMTDDQKAAIETVEVEQSEGLNITTRTKVKIKAHSKIAALKQLAELLGGPEAANSYIERQRIVHKPQLTDNTTTDDAAEEYRRFIGE